MLSPYSNYVEEMKKRVDPVDMMEDHPLNERCIQDVHAVAADCIPQNSTVRRLYDSAQVMQFLAHAFCEFQSCTNLAITLCTRTTVVAGRGTTIIVTLW